MDISYFDLNDGRKLGIRAFEIVSFPITEDEYGENSKHCNDIVPDFSKLVSELHKLCGANAALEFLWLTEKAENQTFNSYVRVFFVLRMIGENEDTLSAVMDSSVKNLLSDLSLHHYGIQKVDIASEYFSSLISNIDSGYVQGIVKREHFIANSNSFFPYYYPDIIPSRKAPSFSSLITALSQQEHSAISFQLFPTCFTQDEALLINELSSRLGQIASGAVIDGRLCRDMQANEPYRVYSYFNSRRSLPTFLFNILTFGNQRDCSNLAARTISLLQNGESDVSNVADFWTIDLSREGIRLKDQFPYYPWNINNRLLFSYRNGNLINKVPIIKRLARLPYILSSEEAATFFCLPAYEKNMTSIKGNQTVHTEEQLAEDVVRLENIQIGSIHSTEGTTVSIGARKEAFTKHALVVGAPGNGKTTFAINLLLQFYEKGIPFLVIEPTKTEYRAMIDVVPDLQVFTPGNNSVVPFILNPFLPPKGIRLEQYIPSLMTAFKAAFSMETPLDVIFLHSIRNCYAKYGWKTSSTVEDKSIQRFGLYEFVQVFKQVVSQSEYKPETKATIETGGTFRLVNLIDQNKYIYDTIQGIDIEDLLKHPTVIELNAIADDEQKALLMALLLIQICLHTKSLGSSSEIKNVMMIDEAHVLLDTPTTGTAEQNKAKGITIKSLQKMIAEIRSFGTGIIIADQKPSKVTNDIVADTDIKVAFRLTEKNERSIISDSINLTEVQTQHLSKLKPGEAFTFFSGLESPKLVVTPDIRAEKEVRLSIEDSELASRCEFWDKREKLLIPYFECSACSMCSRKGQCNIKAREVSDYYSAHILATVGNRIKDQESLRKYLLCLHDLVIQYEKRARTDAPLKLICNCTKIQFARSILLNSNLALSRDKAFEMINSSMIKEN